MSQSLYINFPLDYFSLLNRSSQTLHLVLINSYRATILASPDFRIAHSSRPLSPHAFPPLAPTQMATHVARNQQLIHPRKTVAASGTFLLTVVVAAKVAHVRPSCGTLFFFSTSPCLFTLNCASFSSQLALRTVADDRQSSLAPPAHAPLRPFLIASYFERRCRRQFIALPSHASISHRLIAAYFASRRGRQSFAPPSQSSLIH